MAMAVAGIAEIVKTNSKNPSVNPVFGSTIALRRTGQLTSNLNGMEGAFGPSVAGPRNQGRRAVAHDLLTVVDDAAAVASEQAASAHRVQIPPRINPVAARHHTIMSGRAFGAARRTAPSPNALMP
jgi:hypothetical protein